MSIPEELKKELLEEFEKHLEAARSCPMTPGSLEAIMVRGAQRMARLTQQALAKAASDEADFPPSGVSSLRRGKALQSERTPPAGGDDVGRDRV